jgi:hypothetical protein
MVSVLVFTISANPELDPEPELDEPDPPRLPAVVPVLDPLPEEPDDPLDEELPDPPADTASPAVRLESEAIVPLTGAYSLVLVTAVSAVCTPASAEYTAAWAEAMLPGEGVEVVVAVDVVVFGVELVFGAVLGTTTVTVTLGVVLVAIVFEPDLDFVGDLPGVVPGWKAAYSTVPDGPE